MKSSVLWVAFCLWLVHASFAGEVPKTPEEAKALAEKIVSEAIPPPKMAFDLDAATGLLYFLDSDDPDVRAVAIGKFPEIPGIRLDKCIPYLSDTRLMLSERIAVLVKCVGGLMGTDQGSEGQVKSIARSVLEGSVCPPRLSELTVALAVVHVRHMDTRRKYYTHIASIVTEDKRLLAARRFLSVISDIAQNYRPTDRKASMGAAQKVLEMVMALGEEQAGVALYEWYQIESDPDARRLVVDEHLKWPASPEWKARREQVLELAAKDWDEDIAARAQALLTEGK